VSALGRSVAILAALALASYGAAALTPREELGADLDFATLIPERVGAWVAEPDAEAQVLLVPGGANDTAAAQDASYDDVLMRTYVRDDGARVMIAIAYGRRQTQELKIHRPELCYYAQGFEVSSLGGRDVRLDGQRTAASAALLTRNRSRTEVVTYWIRVGDSLAASAWDTRWTIFREGLRGRVPDGVLVRASSLAESPATAEHEIGLQHAFLADLYRAVPAQTRRLLAGAGSAS
jgi:EpsI family protein